MAEIRINATGGVKLYDADDSHYAQIVAGTITSNVDAITLGHDTVTIADNLSLGSDSAVLKFGADGDTTLTHTDGTGLTLNSTNKLTFGDVASYINQSSDGVLTIAGEATIDLAASTAVTVSNDLKLDSDAAVLSFGADTEIALTHVADTGLKLTDSGGTPTLQLHDSNESIASDGSKVIITSGGTAFSLPTSDGSNGQALVTNGSAVLSFADAGGGKILQVVSATSASSSSSSSYPWTVLTCDITPAATSSKIYIGGSLVAHKPSNAQTGVILQRDSSDLVGSESGTDLTFGSYLQTDTDETATPVPFGYIDSPSTTSATTYNIRLWANGGTSYFNKSSSDDIKFTSTLILMEIGA